MIKAREDKTTLIKIVIISLIAIFFAADRYLKYMALQLPPGESYSLISSIFSFSLSKNPYIAFSLPLSPSVTFPLVIFTITLLSGIIVWLIYKKKRLSLQVLLLTLILLGAISNAIDRWQYGYVIDYLSINNFSIFNIADAMISTGTILYIYLGFKTELK